MAKVNKADYENAMESDDNTVGFILRIEYRNQKTTQYFIADDFEEEIGRLLGTLINGSRTLIKDQGVPVDDDGNRLLTRATFDRLRSRWRTLVKQDA